MLALLTPGSATAAAAGAGLPTSAPHLSFMDRVVMEILETEGVYVRDLQQIIAGYLKVLHSRADCPLGASQLDALFGNIQDVYRFNSNFLRQLEQCDLDPVRVARCFVRNNAGFSVYTEYCTNYPRTVGVLTELMRREATVRLFRERQAALQHTLPLGSYLLKPVQRILKYHLLLQNIVKHSSCERHGRDGYSDIVNALSTMTAIAHHINDMKRRHEHAVRVQEIQSLLYGWEGEDLTTFGELCAEGTFRVAGAKALRHVFLFDKMLLITKKKEESILGYKAHIECSNLMLIESVPGEPLSFHVIPFDNPRMQYTLQARTLEQKREWSLQLKRVILENYHAVIPSHARQLVMELGPSRPDGAIQSDKVTPRRQHSAPEYLERRKQERERRKSETGLRYRLRRNRKSDADTIAESATRRGRRGSSSSREGEREDSILSLADRTRDRIASWRRKSEPAGPALPPGAVGLSSGKRQLSIDLQIPSLDAQPSLPSPVNGTARSAATVGTVVNGNSSSTTTSCEPEKCSSGQVPIENLPSANVLLEPSQVEILPSEPSTDNSTVKEPSTLPSLPQQPVETIEQIVSQLLMQNREFQKILKNQQRQLSRRHRITSQNVAPCAKGETTDEDADEEVEEEEEAIYETLSALATVQHRHLHYSHSHSVECSNDEDDYVTLVCHNGAEVDEDDDEDDAASTRCLEDALGEDGSPPTAPPRPRARLKRGSTASLGKETEAEVEARAGRPATRQDSLQSLWERLRRSQRLGGPGPGSSGRLAASVRRAASFSSQRSARSAHSNSHFYVDTPIGGADCQPITPAVWLKQQGPHLMTASSHKAGSLPRSFQVGPEGEALPGRSKETLRARMLRSGRSCPDRPFTIASDKPSRLSMEDMDERFHSGSFGAQHGDTTEDDSMTEYTATPNASLASLHEPSVHPEYRIYRPTLPFSSMSIRQVLSKLASGLRGSSPASPGGSVADDDWEQQRARLRERRRVAAVVVKQYSKTLRRRIRNLMGDEDTSSPTTPLTPPSEGAQAAIPTTAATTTTTTTTYKQGSSGLGARIASSESDYANPRLLFQHVRPSKKAAALLGVRPDSVLSVVSAASSTFTVSASTSSSSSDGDKTSGFEGSVDTTVGIGRSSKADAAAAKGAAPLTEADMDERTTVVSSSSAGEEVADSDCSADSFYERSFEAMESVLEATDVFRDSAVFSDHDVESDDSSTPPSYPPPPPPPPHQYSTTANLPVSTTTCSTSFSTSDSIVLNLTDSSLPLPVLVSSTHSSRIPMASETTKSKVPPPVPTKPKKTFRASFIVGDLANIPMTPLVSKLSDVGAPLTAPLAVPDQDDSSSTSAASTVIEACASQRSRRASETALWARTSGPEPISLEQLPEGPCTVGSGACPGACGGSCPSGPASKGWVKHVIGRLQGESVG